MFRKNVASQYLYFCLVKAADGTALTGATVTGKRSIDGAAQASVTGTITEDALGQYHLALSQADTNGNDIGYLFTATGAIPVSIHVVTTAADPTDAAAFGLSRLDAAISSRSTYAGGDTSGTTTLLGRIPGTVAAQTGDAYARLGAPAGASVSADVAAVKSDTAAVKAKTDNLPASPAATGAQMDLVAAPNATALNAIADALLKRDWSSVAGEAAHSVLNALRFLRNKWSISAGTLTVTKEDGTTAAWTGTVATDAAAVPVVGNTPS